MGAALITEVFPLSAPPSIGEIAALPGVLVKYELLELLGLLALLASLVLLALVLLILR